MYTSSGPLSLSVNEMPTLEFVREFKAALTALLLCLSIRQLICLYALIHLLIYLPIKILT